MSKNGSILICDYHAGCQAGIWHTLNSIGIEADILSFSGHAHLLQSLGVPKKSILRSPKVWRKAANLSNVGRLASLFRRKYDLAICAFPPPFYRELLKFKIARRVFLVAGHRIDLGIQTHRERLEYFAQLKLDITSGDITVASLNEYDAAYLKHETGVSIETLGCVRKDLNEISNRIRPDRRTGGTLVGPSHVTESQFYHDMKDHFENAAPNATPKTIRSLYPRYTYEQIANHNACVIIPYSTFSISLDELFSLGHRILVPSDKLLNEYKLLNDVKLWPIYTSRENASEFDASESTTSPNTIFDGIPTEWLKVASWNQRAGTERWESFEDLQEKLNTDPVELVSRNIECEHQRAEKIGILWSIKIEKLLRP